MRSSWLRDSTNWIIYETDKLYLTQVHGFQNAYSCRILYLLHSCTSWCLTGGERDTVSPTCYGQNATIE